MTSTFAGVQFPCDLATSFASACPADTLAAALAKLGATATRQSATARDRQGGPPKKGAAGAGRDCCMPTVWHAPDVVESPPTALDQGRLSRVTIHKSPARHI